MEITLLLFAVCFVTTLLVIWFQTNAFIEYFGWIIPDIAEEFYKLAENDLNYKFCNYLAEHYFSSFMTKLVTCEYCFGFWLSVVPCLFQLNLTLLPIIYILSLVLYGIINKLYNG